MVPASRSIIPTASDMQYCGNAKAEIPDVFAERDGPVPVDRRCQPRIGIGKRIVTLLAPRYLRIGGYWYPRGGIPIDVFWQTGTLPAGVWLPDQGVAPYRGRG